MRVLIQNGRIIDGSGGPPQSGNVIIEKGVITGVGAVSAADCDTVLDAGGCVISPGFIDTHSHSDLLVFKEPQLKAKIMQGVTTEFLGQDGISMAPLPRAHISPWKKNLAGLEGVMEELDWGYETTDNYLKMLEKNKSALNLAYLIPHGNVRMEGMGLDSDIADETALSRMRRILEREMQVGGYGFSTGLVYMPCVYADTREVTELCKIAAKYEVPFVIHQRSEADRILESMEEVIAVGRDSGVWVHFSHFKIYGKNNAGKFERVLGLLDKARAEGIRVSFDQYPYIAGSTMLSFILPPWAHDGGTDKLLARLADPEARKRLSRDIRNGVDGWDNLVGIVGMDVIFVTDVKTDKNRDAIGKNMVQLGEMRGKEPLEAAFDLMYEEDNAVGMVNFNTLEEHVKAFIARPEMNVCTDGLLGGKPHPRVYGAFPRVLGKYVREEKVVSLPEAVRKMTARPAEVFGIKDRGLLKPGYAADVTVFDPDVIIDKSTYEEPRQYPDGIVHVLVNGMPVVRDGVHNPDILPGRVLRKNR